MKAIEPTLRARGIVVGYANRPPVLDHVDIDVLDGELTVIVGPNACGKSTLLRSLARVLALRGGRVLLDGQDIRAMNQKGVARRLGLLPQSPQAPDDMLVEELVGRGRYPYQSLVRQWSEADDDAVERAMADAGVAGLAARRLSELSGGQRQRVWIAMALAQCTRGAHGRGRPARPPPRLPLRHALAGHEGRAPRRAGAPRADRDRRTHRGRLLRGLPHHRRP